MQRVDEGNLKYGPFADPITWVSSINKQKPTVWFELKQNNCDWILCGAHKSLFYPCTYVGAIFEFQIVCDDPKWTISP